MCYFYDNFTEKGSILKQVDINFYKFETVTCSSLRSTTLNPHSLFLTGSVFMLMVNLLRKPYENDAAYFKNTATLGSSTRGLYVTSERVSDLLTTTISK